METQAVYHAGPKTIPAKQIYCQECGTHLGDETKVYWKHDRRGMIETGVFVRTFAGMPAVRCFVRCEIICMKCKETTVWRA